MAQQTIGPLEIQTSPTELLVERRWPGRRKLAYAILVGSAALTGLSGLSTVLLDRDGAVALVVVFSALATSVLGGLLAMTQPVAGAIVTLQRSLRIRVADTSGDGNEGQAAAVEVDGTVVGLLEDVREIRLGHHTARSRRTNIELHPVFLVLRQRVVQLAECRSAEDAVDLAIAICEFDGLAHLEFTESETGNPTYTLGLLYGVVLTWQALMAYFVVGEVLPFGGPLDALTFSSFAAAGVVVPLLLFMPFARSRLRSQQLVRAAQGFDVCDA